MAREIGYGPYAPDGAEDAIALSRLLTVGHRPTLTPFEKGLLLAQDEGSVPPGQRIN